MEDGFWLNYGEPNKSIFGVHEHERWLRFPGNAKDLGLPKKIIAAFKDFKPAKDRDKLLVFVIGNAPVMRVRCHGVYTTFEYASSKDSLPLKAVYRWCRMFAGPVLFLRIVNLKTGVLRTGFPGLKLTKESLACCISEPSAK